MINCNKNRRPACDKNSYGAKPVKCCCWMKSLKFQIFIFFRSNIKYNFLVIFYHYRRILLDSTFWLTSKLYIFTILYHMIYKYYLFIFNIKSFLKPKINLIMIYKKEEVFFFNILLVILFLV